MIGPFFFLVKREIANFFLVNRDFHSGREAWFCKVIFRETRNKCLIRREPWFSLCLCYLHRVTMMSWLIPVMLRQRGWSGFRWPSASHHFPSSVSSISTIMAEAHQSASDKKPPSKGWYSSSEHVSDCCPPGRTEVCISWKSRTTWTFKERGKRRRAYIEEPRGRGWIGFRIDGFGLKKRTDCGFVR